MNAIDFRFRHDVERDVEAIETEAAENWVRRQHLASSVKVVPEILPSLDACIRSVERGLGFRKNSVDCYLFNSGDIQASCAAAQISSSPLLLLSSQLVRMLSNAELRFVIGHELGHYIFRHPIHTDDSVGSPGMRLRKLARQRCAEISCDRVGLLATNDIDTAVRALLKTVTGLPDEFLRFDVSAILKQINELRSLGGSPAEALSTHPMFMLRIKALLWFQMSTLWWKQQGRSGTAPLGELELDERIHDELSEISGFNVVQSEEEEIRRACLWGTVLLFLEDEVIDRSEEDALVDYFGEIDGRKAAAFAREFGVAEVREKFAHVAGEIAHDEWPLIDKLDRYFCKLVGDCNLSPANEVTELLEKYKRQ